MNQLERYYGRGPTRTFYSRGVFLVILLFAALASPGCQSSGEGTEAQDRLSVAVIPKGTTHEFWRSVHAGAVKASRELDIDIVWQGPQKEDDRQMQIQVVQNFISRGIDGIVLAPLDARSMVQPVEAAVRRNIPVVIIDSGLESEVQSSFVATNNYAGGQLGADRLAALLGNRGKVVLLRYQEGSASTTAREQGFLDRLQEVAPDIELISSQQYAGATIERGLQASQNLLNRFAEIDGIFCPNETSTLGMLRALQTAGRTDEVKFVGFDANESLINAMRNGEIHGLVLQDPFNMGYTGVKIMLSVIRGETVAPRIDTRLALVTPENMDDPEMQDLLHPDLATWLDE